MTKLEITALMLAFKRLIAKNDMEGIEQIVDTLLLDARGNEPLPWETKTDEKKESQE
ncbi:MAG: hypothetical protein FWF44_00315 [Defluviitaleaceae bacterium]|nr:hypothetical protein [Defluviitaleaceae bacterium]